NDQSAAREVERRLRGVDHFVVVDDGVAPRGRGDLRVARESSPPRRGENSLAHDIDAIDDRWGRVDVRGGEVDVAPNIDVVEPSQVESEPTLRRKSERGNVAVHEPREAI